MDNKENIINFIEDYKQLPVLWQVNLKEYSNKEKRSDAMKYLCDKYKLDIKMCKNKIKSLRSYFSKEYQKCLKKKSGSSAEENYISSWFAYKHLLFLKDTLTPGETKDTDDIIFTKSNVST